ncbi:MAG: protoheme IX farnesyltransferase [Lewinellaceae bacterium]|nr:protoheme IX farnesyltransferase [Lewinellaceae bacterium]
MVLFSALISYSIAGFGQVTWVGMLLLAIGGFLVTGAANALNQVLERDYDRLMPRTANRPVATGRMSVSTAVLWAGMMALFGVTILSLFNPLTGFLGMLSLISYAFIYTPLKRSTPLAVVVGAIPGALPLVIGCTAWEGVLSSTALILFTIQFLWQFPHFWAVAWVADEDYKRAGFFMLPSRNGEKNEITGLLSFLFCVLMIVNAGIGYAIGFTGVLATLALIGINTYFAHRCWSLYRTCSLEAARRQMFASFLHLPLSLIIILLDKI